MKLALLLLALCHTVAATGGATCVACGLISGLLFESAKTTDELNTLFLATSLERFKLSSTQWLGLNPDTFCATLKLCEPSCKLFPNKWPVTPPPAPHKDPKNVGGRTVEALTVLKDALVSLVDEHEAQQSSTSPHHENFFDLATRLASLLSNKKTTMSAETAAAKIFPLLQPSHPCAATNVTCLVHRFLDNHLPISDTDGDNFATMANRGLRGSHWRGADCNDKDVDVYPGRKVSTSGDPTIDHDCNGISGTDASTNQTYETLYCDHTPRRGLIHIGDSATAHFHLPPQWLSKHGWGVRNLITDAEDEMDQPACAWGTGFRNFSSCPWSPNKTTNQGSIAERLWRRNACNHRDFQNVGVNGARSTAALPLVDSANRNADTDHPVLAIFSLIGNDVCNGHPGTTHMTPPATFHEYVTKSLQALDAKLPKGSYVVLVGLVDGRVLFDNMHARQHPIGATYEEVYGYLNCNSVNPCHGWLNSNETMRNATTDWRNSLNKEYENIIATQQYDNFKMNFFNPDWRAYIDEYVADGGDAGDCIEPSDGFHPSQTGNELFSKYLWAWLENNFPAAIGDINPSNAEILKTFPGQGGL
jgi:acyloxyacyl hydrolase